MDPTTLTIAGLALVAGIATAGYWYGRAREYRSRWEYWKDSANAAHEAHGETIDTLNELRRNCFLTDEKGHRVRYVNASPEVRAKAEGQS